MVTVTSATSTAPTVFPLSPCGSVAGDTVTLGCLATGFSPSSLTYTWSKRGVALTDFIQYPPVLKGNVYTGVSQIQVKKQEWDKLEPFKCVATHAAGNAEATIINKPVLHKLPTLSVLASCDEKKEASFSCFAKDFSPKDYKLKWLKNNEEITNKIHDIKTPLKEEKNENGTLYSVASFLTVPHGEWTEGVEFTCKFEGKGEQGSQAFVNSSVTYTSTPNGDDPGCPKADVNIVIEGPTLEDMFRNRKGEIVCRVYENKSPIDSVWWEDQSGNKLLGANLVKEESTQILSLDISYDEWSGNIKRYCCVEHKAWIVPMKKSYEREIGGPSLRPSVFMLPPVEHTRKDQVTLTCYVKDFFPKDVFVSWLIDDEEHNHEYHTTNPVENNGSYSAYGQLLIPLKEWEQDGSVYSCAVHHQSMGNMTKVIIRSVGRRTFDRANLVNLNMNVPDCKA